MASIGVIIAIGTLLIACMYGGVQWWQTGDRFALTFLMCIWVAVYGVICGVTALITWLIEPGTSLLGNYGLIALAFTAPITGLGVLVMLYTWRQGHSG